MRGGGREPVRATLDKSFETQIFAMKTEAGLRRTWSCGNQPAYHSMINRRSVPALHRACLHQRNQPEGKKSAGCNFTFKPLENGHDSGSSRHGRCNGFCPPMNRSPTFSPAAPTKTPPPSFIPPATKHSPPGPRLPAWRWPRNHACRRPPLNPSRLPLFHRRQVDGAPRWYRYSPALPPPAPGRRPARCGSPVRRYARSPGRRRRAGCR